MDCPSCSAVEAIVDGRCRWCHAVVARPCPRCHALVKTDDKFCTACGTAMMSRRRLIALNEERAEIRTKLGRARRWLAALAILSSVGALVICTQHHSEVERQIESAEQATRGLTPAQRDAGMKVALGLTWDEAMARERRKVFVVFAINAALAGSYIGLWHWAKRNVLAASLAALALFVTVNVASFVLQPDSMARGWIMNIAIAGVLLKAVLAATEERKLYGSSG